MIEGQGELNRRSLFFIHIVYKLNILKIKLSDKNENLNLWQMIKVFPFVHVSVWSYVFSRDTILVQDKGSKKNLDFLILLVMSFVIYYRSSNWYKTRYFFEWIENTFQSVINLRICIC